jgi:hypothetical protein
MLPVPPRTKAINIVALGVAMSAALIVLYVFCAGTALLWPDESLMHHGWMAVFTAYPVNTAANWIEGIGESIVFGWITAVVLGSVYNLMEHD